MKFATKTTFMMFLSGSINNGVTTPELIVKQKKTQKHTVFTRFIGNKINTISSVHFRE